MCVAVKARNPAGDEGLVPENYIRVWNPVDDVGDSDTSEVNVDDDDIPSRHHRLAYTDGKLIGWNFVHFVIFRRGIAGDFYYVLEKDRILHNL